MKKHIYDENHSLWHELISDYYIPVLTLSSEEQCSIGKWGLMHRDYLKEHCPILFNDLILSDQFWTYLADLSEQAQKRLSLIVEQMKAAERVTEKLKASDQMTWVGAMNNIRNRAKKIILQELICGEDVHETTGRILVRQY